MPLYETEETGEARMLGSGVPGWFAGRVMGFKGDSSRKDFVSGSTDSVMSVLVAS